MKKIAFFLSILAFSSVQGFLKGQNFDEKLLDSLWQIRNYAGAIQYLNFIETHCNSVECEFLVNFSKAKTYQFMNLTDSSLVYYVKNDGFEKDILDPELVARNFSNYALLLLAKRKYEESKKMLHVAYQFTSDSLLYQKSVILANLGVVSRSLGDYKSAISYYEQSLEGLKQNPASQLQILINISNSYNKIGDFLRSEEVLNEAIKISERINNKNDKLRYNLYSSIGSLYFRNNDIDLALDYYNQAYQIIKNSEYASKKDESQILSNIGLVFKTKNEYQKAIEHFKGAINKQFENNEQFDNVAPVYLAKTYYELGNLNDAEKYYTIALRNNLKANRPERLAELYVFYAQLEFARNRNNQALTYLKKSEEILLQISDKHYFLNENYIELSHFFLRSNQPDSALFYVNKSMNSILEQDGEITGINYPENLNSHSKIRLLKSVKLKSEIIEIIAKQNADLDLLDAALQGIEISNKLIQELRVSVLDDETRLFITENEKVTLIRGFELSKRLYDLTHDFNYFEKAFSFIENTKSPTLLTNVKELEARKSVKIPDSLLVQEKLINQQMIAYKELIYEENRKNMPDSDKLSNWGNEIFNLMENKNRLISYLEQNYHAYYELKYGFKTIDLHEFIGQLEADQIFVEYLFSDDILYSMVISRDTSYIQQIEIDSEFKRNLLEYRKFVESVAYDISLNDFNAMAAVGSKLFEKLLGVIHQLSSNSRFIIVPDEELSFIPFEALITKHQKYDVLDFGIIPYVVNKYVISYAYSASLLFSNTNSLPKNNEIVAFAPEYGIHEESNVRRADTSGLVNLKGAFKEVNDISELYESEVFTKERANETRFKEMAQNYKVLHLAMHALVDTANPDFSKLVFSFDENPDNDGFLNYIEVKNLEINSPLAVLSACNTGFGKLSKGEGVMSLARSFKYAGCPSIVMTLWDIADNISSDLMIKFYSELAEGESKDLALQRAKVEYFKSADPIKAHPYYWAGYILIGENAPIPKKSPRVNYGLILGFISGLLLISFFIKVYRY